MRAARHRRPHCQRPAGFPLRRPGQPDADGTDAGARASRIICRRPGTLAAAIPADSPPPRQFGRTTSGSTSLADPRMPARGSGGALRQSGAASPRSQAERVGRPEAAGRGRRPSVSAGPSPLAAGARPGTGSTAVGSPSRTLDAYSSRLSQASNVSAAHVGARHSNSHRPRAGGAVSTSPRHHATVRANTPAAISLPEDICRFPRQGSR
jgi:hypothetical protein